MDGPGRNVPTKRDDDELLLVDFGSCFSASSIPYGTGFQKSDTFPAGGRLTMR